MSIKWVTIFIFVLFSLSGMIVEVKDSGADGGPVISGSFASKELVPGDTWKVYINASVPDASLKYVFATVEQAGGMAYPLSITRIKPKNQKEISGYLILNTSTADRPMDYVTLNLVLHIRDDKGRFSAPAVFPLTFQARAVQENPPSGVFQEKDVGPIMIRLRPVADDGQGGSSFGN